MSNRIALIIVCLAMGAAAGFVGAMGYATALRPSGEPGIELEAPAARMIVLDSAFGVAQTMDRLEQAVGAAGAKVFARIDHGAGAASIDQDLAPSQVLIFGNPELGTPLLQSEPMAGLDLPLRVLVWEDETGAVKLAYLDPAALARQYGIDGQDQFISRIRLALANLTGHATRGQ